jgi:hypothetical protein
MCISYSSKESDVVNQQNPRTVGNYGEVNPTFEAAVIPGPETEKLLKEKAKQEAMETEPLEVIEKRAMAAGGEEDGENLKEGEMEGENDANLAELEEKKAAELEEKTETVQYKYDEWLT